MRLTGTQLRKIIREEASRALKSNGRNKYSLRFLLEAEAGEDPVATAPGAAKPEMDSTKVKWGSNYEEFVKALKTNAADKKVQAFIGAGKLDQDENDDKFSFSEVDLDVSGLTPTQNEIDVDKSLAFPLKKGTSLVEYIKGAGQSFQLGSPIVTYQGKYIIDGHHRWSQLYACNKDAKIKAVDINVEGLQPLDVLKAVQAAIAIETGNVPVQKVKGTNLLKIDKAGLNAWMDKFNASPAVFAYVADDAEAVAIMEEVVGGTPKNEGPEDVDAATYDRVPQLIADYLWVNVEDMQANSQPVAGAPKRDFMPQTDDVDWMRPLEAGEVDINEPHVSSESRRRNGGSVILERWQRLAGLIK